MGIAWWGKRIRGVGGEGHDIAGVEERRLLVTGRIIG
jgi:hypothetical protein